MVWRDGERVRLFTRRGFDWTRRYPLIVDSARQLPVTRFLIDGEAVCCGGRRGRFRTSPQPRQRFRRVLYGFDLLALDGTDIRHQRLEWRRAKLARLRARPKGIHFSEDHNGDAAVMFDHACRMGLEGIVSKRRDAAYRSGRSKTWLKTKNPESPAMRRLVENDG
jgi:bifunctional non-homologous end joining protein LigD